MAVDNPRPPAPSSGTRAAVGPRRPLLLVATPSTSMPGLSLLTALPILYRPPVLLSRCFHGGHLHSLGGDLGTAAACSGGFISSRMQINFHFNLLARAETDVKIPGPSLLLSSEDADLAPVRQLHCCLCGRWGWGGGEGGGRRHYNTASQWLMLHDGLLQSKILERVLTR